MTESIPRRTLDRVVGNLWPTGLIWLAKKSSGWRFLRLRHFVAIWSSIANGARDKSEILVLDIAYKNILNENKQ